MIHPPPPSPTAQVHSRTRSLHKLALRLRRAADADNFLPPVGRELAHICAQLDTMCDTIERLCWRLEDTNHA